MGEDVAALGAIGDLPIALALRRDRMLALHPQAEVDEVQQVVDDIVAA